MTTPRLPGRDNLRPKGEARVLRLHVFTPRQRRSRAALYVLLSLVVLSIVLATLHYLYVRPPLVELCATPTRFSRRSNDFPVTLCGEISRAMAVAQRSLRYRVNDGPWRDVGAGEEAPPRLFLVEVPAREIWHGYNRVEIDASALALAPQRRAVSFFYDATPPALPFTADWRGELELDRGGWEVLGVGAVRRVRPLRGREGAALVLPVAGVFAGGRRVRTQMTLRYGLHDRPFSFGVMPMWGGRPDRTGVSPRRGWSYSLAGWRDRYHGCTSEFSYRHGRDAARWVVSHRNLPIETGRRYEVVAEAWPEVDRAGRHLRHRQRVKLWADNEREPDTWLETSDDQGAPLPAGEYGVALFADWAQVEFGPVRVEPMPVVVPPLLTVPSSE